MVTGLKLSLIGWRTPFVIHAAKGSLLGSLCLIFRQKILPSSKFVSPFNRSCWKFSSLNTKRLSICSVRCGFICFTRRAMLNQSYSYFPPLWKENLVEKKEYSRLSLLRLMVLIITSGCYCFRFCLDENNTFNLIERPNGYHGIENRFSWRIKFVQFGNIAKYKSRLVAKGYQQVAGIDYGETY